MSYMQWKGQDFQRVTLKAYKHWAFLCFSFRDGDGVLDEFDNCPDLPNGDQADADGDNKGYIDELYWLVKKGYLT